MNKETITEYDIDGPLEDLQYKLDQTLQDQEILQQKITNLQSQLSTKTEDLSILEKNGKLK